MSDYFYYFDSNINRESVQKLIDDTFDKSKVTLYFSTDGGCINSSSFLTSYLNSRVDDLTIVFTESVSSAGCDLIVDYKGQIYYTQRLDFLMFHMTDRSNYRFRKDSYYNKDIISKQDFDLNVLDSKKFLKIGLTQEEVNRFLDGEDVYLYKNDFHRLPIKFIEE